MEIFHSFMALISIFHCKNTLKRASESRVFRPRVAELGSLSSESKKNHENFCQMHIYNFHDKCVVFARNHKFANLTQYNMQCIPCKSALRAQGTLFLAKKGSFFAQRYRQSA